MKTILLAAMLGMSATVSAQAHAFLDHADPEVGKSIKEMPKEVKLTFSEPVEPKFSQVKVFDATGKQVDEKNAHPDPKNAQVLIVSLPASRSAGTYKVDWRVVAKDTHVTQGNFTFTKEP